MKRIIPLILLFTCLLLPAAFTQSEVESRIKRLEGGLLGPVLVKGEAPWTLEERMKHHRVPGVSIAVIKDHRVEWARAYGLKDVETREPVTTETLFQAGSISKPVAAMVALKKVEEGKIALEANINDRLTTWKLPDNELTGRRQVSLANLLSHTGGLTVHGFPGYAVGKPLPTLPQVLDGAAPANTAPVRVDLEPGTKFRYSGGGTTIAQLAIMDIERKPYPQIAEATVLKPLAMTHSTYQQPLPADWRSKAASGHRREGQLVEGRLHIYPEMAAAGLWTTPTDLAKFAIEVQLSLVGRSNKVLSKEMAAKMVTPYLPDAPGLGFFIERYGEAVYFGHGGADEGFRAQLLVHRDRGYGAVVMVNSDNGQIIPEIMRGIAREYGWENYLPAPYEPVAVNPQTLDAYLGRYRIDADRVVTVTKENGRLYAEQTERGKSELLPISETTFVRRDQDVRVAFVKNPAGEVNAIRVTAGRTTTEVPRIPAATLIPYELLMAGRQAEAIEGYRRIRAEDPRHPAIAENRLNSLGYQLLQQGRTAEAIAIFKVNVELYPQSWNVYDSLGEAYLASGDRERASASYRRSLELNPKNESAVQALKKISGQ
jgi:CubicO group peptidase (beta-lactamase class C family)